MLAHSASAECDCQIEGVTRPNDYSKPAYSQLVGKDVGCSCAICAKWDACLGLRAHKGNAADGGHQGFA
jgi:hypothetical protein